MKMIAQTLLACLILNIGKAADLLESKRSHELKDWFHAEWFDNLVKIPLIIDERTVWYANLIPNDDEAGYCLIDNNSAYTVVFPTYGTATNWYDRTQEGSNCDTTSEIVITEDGA